MSEMNGNVTLCVLSAVGSNVLKSSGDNFSQHSEMPVEHCSYSVKTAFLGLLLKANSKFGNPDKCLKIDISASFYSNVVGVGAAANTKKY